MSYTHFTIKQRIKLEGYLEDDLSKAKIAKRLGFNRSSITREINIVANVNGQRLCYIKLDSDFVTFFGYFLNFSLDIR